MLDNCYDNAVAASFFHTLKVELIHGESFATRQDMRLTVFEYIGVDYNRNRRRSANGYISPWHLKIKLPLNELSVVRGLDQIIIGWQVRQERKVDVADFEFIIVLWAHINWTEELQNNVLFTTPVAALPGT